MTILCLDTSTRFIWLALYDESGRICCTGFQDRQTCLVNLMPALKNLLALGHTPLSKVQAIATVTGPGTWSSLRIGLTTVKQLSLVNRIPLVLTSNLDLLAYHAQMLGFQHETILSVLDAQSGYIYAGLYTAKSNAVPVSFQTPQWTTPDQLVKHFALEDMQPGLIIGDCAPVLEPYLPNWKNHSLQLQSTPAYLDTLAMFAHQPQSAFDYATTINLKPLYIQPSSAEVEFEVVAL